MPTAAAVKFHRARDITAQPLTIAALWIIVLSSFVAMLAKLPPRASQPDFSHYFVSALAMRQHLNPYVSDLRPFADRLGLNLGEMNQATNPPTFILCFEVLTFFPPPVAYWIWIWLNVLMFALSLYLLLFKVSSLNTHRAWFIGAFAVIYLPVSDHFYYAQTQILILLMIVLALYWMGQEKEMAAGLMFAFASLLRIFPLLLAVYLVVRRRWRVAGHMVMGIALGGVVTLAIAGVSLSLSFVDRFRFLTGGYWIYRTFNVALGSFASRMFAYAFGAPSGTLAVVRTLIVVVLELSLLALTVAATRTETGEPDQDWRKFSLWIVAMILLSPTAWFHYLVLLLIPFVQIFSAAQHGRASGRAVAAAVASYSLVTVAALVLALLGPSPGPATEVVLRESAFGSLAIAYLAAYWFVRDSASELSPARGGVRTIAAGAA